MPWVLIAVHRGCISEQCGFRQRRVAAQELKSTTQRKTSRLLNTLEAKLCVRDTVVDRSSVVSSVELCQVGIEHMYTVQLEELCYEFRQKTESLRIL
jgi:hypothetical protein